MRKTIQTACLFATTLCYSSFAAAPVGTVTSESPFQLGGAGVRTDGVPSWPLVPGEAVTAGAKNVVIRLKDGTRVNLRAQSRAVVEERAGGLSFRLLSGSMSVLAGAASTTLIFKNTEQVTAPPKVETAFAVTTPAAGQLASGDAVNSVRRPPPRPVSSR